MRGRGRQYRLLCLRQQHDRLRRESAGAAGVGRARIPAKENKGGMGGLLVLLVVALAVGGGALYYFKLRNP